MYAYGIEQDDAAAGVPDGVAGLSGTQVHP